MLLSKSLATSTSLEKMEKPLPPDAAPLPPAKRSDAFDSIGT